MTEKLCQLFFGNKHFKIDSYETFKSTKVISEEQVKQIFQSYSEKLNQQISEDGSCTKLVIFTEFIGENMKKFHNWQFEKFSSWIQISAHVFEHSMENCLSKKQSFDYFSAVLVRHCLFRPPHSVNIFNYEECQKITEYWLGSFIRFYEQYSLCMMPNHNQIIETLCTSLPVYEANMKSGLIIEREKLGDKIWEELGVTKLNKSEEKNG